MIFSIIEIFIIIFLFYIWWVSRKVNRITVLLNDLCCDSVDSKISNKEDFDRIKYMIRKILLDTKISLVEVNKIVDGVRGNKVSPIPEIISDSKKSKKQNNITLEDKNIVIKCMSNPDVIGLKIVSINKNVVELREVYSDGSIGEWSLTGHKDYLEDLVESVEDLVLIKDLPLPLGSIETVDWWKSKVSMSEDKKEKLEGKLSDVLKDILPTIKVPYTKKVEIKPIEPTRPKASGAVIMKRPKGMIGV